MKVTKQKRLKLVGGNVLVVGIDIAKKKHCAVAINREGFELCRPFFFSNSKEGFDNFLERIERIRSMNGMDKVVFGFEPTGHYWKPLIYHLDKEDKNVVLVNPAHTHWIRELEDNSPTKVDPKDATLVANLVKEGKFSFLSLPKGVYAELRELSNLWDRLKKKLWRAKNELFNLLDKFFPEYYRGFKDIYSKSSIHLLGKFPLPTYIIEVGKEMLLEELKEASHGRINAKQKAELLFLLAKETIGIREGSKIARVEAEMLIEEIRDLEKRIDKVKDEMKRKLEGIEEAKYLLSIKGLGVVTVARFFGEIGNINHYTTPSQIEKLAGLNLKENTSGEKKGGKEITRRGRRHLRAILYRAVVCMIAKNRGQNGGYKNREFGEYYQYLVNKHNMEEMKAITKICCKLIRVMFSLCKNKEYYDGEKVFPRENVITKMIAA